MNDTKIPYKLLIVDDHTLFRKGLRSLLDNEKLFKVVGEATDGLSGLKQQKLLDPDVILLDIDMPTMGGVEALSLMMDYNPNQAILMLTVSEDNTNLVDCMRLGARGYLLKNIDTTFLINSIEKAIHGDSVLSPEMTSILVNQLKNQYKTKPGIKDFFISNETESLTNREKEIIKWLASGVSNKVIAKNLKVTESTVKVHVQNILRKLNLVSRVQAAVYAVENNLD